uniref:Uncharacterized protein n=1 Tax=Panagrolaimus sp. PS1159 TaxID=55785 RepID=A0AC35GA09_9BILA
MLRIYGIYLSKFINDRD